MEKRYVVILENWRQCDAAFTFAVRQPFLVALLDKQESHNILFLVPKEVEEQFLLNVAKMFEYAGFGVTDVLTVQDWYKQRDWAAMEFHKKINREE